MAYWLLDPGDLTKPHTSRHTSGIIPGTHKREFAEVCVPAQARSSGDGRWFFLMHELLKSPACKSKRLDVTNSRTIPGRAWATYGRAALSLLMESMQMCGGPVTVAVESGRVHVRPRLTSRNTSAGT